MLKVEIEKKNFNYTKRSKKIAIKRIWIKIDIKINFIFYWRVKLKGKFNFTKRLKKQSNG
jgi:hypothetical protein